MSIIVSTKIIATIFPQAEGVFDIRLVLLLWQINYARTLLSDQSESVLCKHKKAQIYDLKNEISFHFLPSNKVIATA